MPPPIVQLTIAYGAGLWVGLVFLVPHAGLLLLGLAALIVTRYGRWPGVVAAAGALGLLAGALRARDNAQTCRLIWAAGPQTATLVVHDAPGRRGTATGTVVHATAGCRGKLRLRMRPGGAPAGARIVAVGTPAVWGDNRAGQDR